jgi:hypothetical protein
VVDELLVVAMVADLVVAAELLADVGRGAQVARPVAVVALDVAQEHGARGHCAGEAWPAPMRARGARLAGSAELLVVAVVADPDLVVVAERLVVSGW